MSPPRWTNKISEKEYLPAFLAQKLLTVDLTANYKETMKSELVNTTPDSVARQRKNLSPSIQEVIGPIPVREIFTLSCAHVILITSLFTFH